MHGTEGGGIFKDSGRSKFEGKLERSLELLKLFIDRWRTHRKMSFGKQEEEAGPGNTENAEDA